MSTNLFATVLLAAAVAATGVIAVPAQSISATITIDAVGKTARVDGRFTEKGRSDPRNLVLLNEIAGVTALADRVNAIELDDADGGAVSSRRLQPGEVLAERDFTRFRYTVALEPAKDRTRAARASWIGNDAGVLFLDDLLPQVASPKALAAVQIVSPKGWKLAGFDASRPVEIERTAVWLFREGTFRQASSAADPFDVYVSGDWNFTDGEAVKSVREILTEYGRIFGSLPSRRPAAAVIRFPGAAPAGVWEADTRGRSATIISSDAVFASQAVQKLHEQLRHELFHLWIPNDVELTGRYDWFYEGAALYSSLKAGVAANRLRFDDYLKTVSGALVIDRMESRRMPLVERAGARSSRNATYIYARGLLAAFLLDLELLKASRGRRSFENVLRKLYSEHRSQPADANAVLESIFREEVRSDRLWAAVAAGVDAVDPAPYLAGTGLVLTAEKRIAAAEKPASREKAILDKLGYNNWRKLSQAVR